ncbi:MAG: DsbA family protein [Rhodospirillales bacterium]|nr:DsbA family protein [Rhodospirillales bacterium]
MAFSIDLFWSFRSPYCYLALDRLLALAENQDVEINVRPVYPIAVRTPDFFNTINPLYRSYHTLDSHRVAESLGLAFRRPIPDPIQMNDGIPDPEQPFIFSLTRLGQAAVMAGKGLEFLDQVSRILWDGSIDGWDQGAHLADAMTRAGLDAEKLESDVAAEPQTFDAAIEENQAAHLAAGHWGVPLMVLDDEPFYGQDRIDLLIRRMRQKGL